MIRTEDGKREGVEEERKRDMEGWGIRNKEGRKVMEGREDES